MYSDHVSKRAGHEDNKKTTKNAGGFDCMPYGMHGIFIEIHTKSVVVVGNLRGKTAEVKIILNKIFVNLSQPFQITSAVAETFHVNKGQ
jgi:hypothetical protein